MGKIKVIDEIARRKKFPLKIKNKKINLLISIFERNLEENSFVIPQFSLLPRSCSFESLAKISCIPLLNCEENECFVPAVREKNERTTTGNSDLEGRTKKRYRKVRRVGVAGKKRRNDWKSMWTNSRVVVRIERKGRRGTEEGEQLCSSPLSFFFSPSTRGATAS